jgi:hypothetical protein
MSKTEIIAALKGKSKKIERKAYPLRVENSVFEEIEKINESSGINNINEILNLLIKLGLEEFKKA